jgi:crotonobetainyl-CoA:carnitine CoA-transferase CaiB-like acyl-CoA transferase
MCAKEKFYRNLVRIIGAPELANDPRFDSFETRLANRDELILQLKKLTQQKSTATWLELLKGHVPCAPVNSVEEAFADPQVLEDEMILDLPHPEFGTVKTVAGPIKISDSSIEHRRGPKLGEHTEEVLQELLDLSPEAISEYRQEGVL